MITVLVVDDEPVVCSGLRLIIESDPDLRVVAEAGDGASAVAMARQHRPDVVCMDVRMPQVDDLRATELVLALPEPPRVLVVTMFESDDYVFEALRAGAAGFVLKRATAEELLAAVHAVAVGITCSIPTVCGRWHCGTARPHRPRSTSGSPPARPRC